MFFTASACSASKKENLDAELDAFCNLFDDVMRLNLKPQARLTYVKNNIKTRVDSKELIEAFEIISKTRFNKRYPVFKKAVEGARGVTWTCSALDKFLK